MKFRRIYLLLLAAALLASCSDDSESWNTQSATVSMGQQELSFKENRGIVNIPVTVEGERNGSVQVTVQVAETGETPAMDDIHYLVTQKTIVIPADATVGNIQIATVDDPDINEGRTFTMTITEANGATIGTNKTTSITLTDNDALFYERLQGRWTFNAFDLKEGETVNYNVTIAGYEEGEAGYDETLYIIGMLGYEFMILEVTYSFDILTETVTLSIPMDAFIAEGVGFGPDVVDLVSATDMNDELNYTEAIPGVPNDDFTTITFQQDRILYFVMRYTGTQTFFDVFTGCDKMTLTR